MAVTSIWSIKGWIGKVINYAENPEKTKNQIDDVIAYAVNEEKTRQSQMNITESELVGEGEALMEQYVSGINCSPTTVREKK